jgi:hypothetical protein
MAVYVGIDVHKHYCQAAFMNDRGTITHEVKFDNATQGASSLITLAKTIDPEVEAVVELCARLISYTHFFWGNSTSTSSRILHSQIAHGRSPGHNAKQKLIELS